MAAWLRREHEPDKSLTEARKELVHSYIDPGAHARQEAAEAAARQRVATAQPTPEQPREPELKEPAPPALINSTGGLPLYEWVKAATQPDEATARVDWTRELVRTKKNALTG